MGRSWRWMACVGAAVHLVGAAWSHPARAAVRDCKPLVIGAAREAADENVSKKLALESWLGLAQQYGPGYTRWQLADGRVLNCRRLPAGAFQCQAAGAPCTIQQNPEQPGSPGRPQRGRGLAT
jgi:hypothetical protein